MPRTVPQRYRLKETFSVTAKRTSNWTRFSQICLTAIAAGGLIQTSACHRGYYRRQADTEATKLISDKANDPHWALMDRTKVCGASESESEVPATLYQDACQTN